MADTEVKVTLSAEGARKLFEALDAEPIVCIPSVERDPVLGKPLSEQDEAVRKCVLAIVKEKCPAGSIHVHGPTKHSMQHTAKLVILDLFVTAEIAYDESNQSEDGFMDAIASRTRAALTEMAIKTRDAFIELTRK